MVDEAVCIIETIADDTWVTWAGWLVPNIACCVREEVDMRDCKEKERKICEEAEAKERLVHEKAKRVMQREQCQQEKLDLFLNEFITAEEFERDLEEEVERGEVMGEEVIKEVVGTQISEMEVDNKGEDEVVAEEKKSRGGRKWVLSSPPKLSRKWARALTTVASKSGVVKKAPGNTSMATICDWCLHHNTKCVLTDGGAQCTNCKAKHYRCSLVLAKESSEGKGGLSAMHHTATVAGGRTKAQEKKEAAKKVKAFDRVMLGRFLFLLLNFWIRWS